MAGYKPFKTCISLGKCVWAFGVSTLSCTATHTLTHHKPTQSNTYLTQPSNTNPHSGVGLGAGGGSPPAPPDFSSSSSGPGLGEYADYASVLPGDPGTTAPVWTSSGDYPGSGLGGMVTSGGDFGSSLGGGSVGEEGTAVVGDSGVVSGPLPGSNAEPSDDHDGIDMDMAGSADVATGPTSGDYPPQEDESQDEEESKLNLNGTTFVIIINDNDHINSVSLATPDKFMSITRPNVSHDSPSGNVGYKWSATPAPGTNRLLCILAF